MIGISTLYSTSMVFKISKDRIQKQMRSRGLGGHPRVKDTKCKVGGSAADQTTLNTPL